MDPRVSRQERRERSRALFQALAFAGAVLLLILVIVAAAVVQGNQRSAEEAIAAATAQEEAVQTAAPAATAAARRATAAWEMAARHSTPVPAPTEAIALSNAGRVQEVARWGKGLLSAVAWSPGGGRLAVGTTVGVHLYDARTGEEKGFLETYSWVWQVAFSPDDEALAVLCSDNVVHIWRVADSMELRTVGGLPGLARQVRFAADGTLIVAGQDTQLYCRAWLWRERDGHVERMPCGTSWWTPPDVVPLDFAADGRFWATAVNGYYVLLRSVGSVEMARKLEWPLHTVARLALSPDGQFLAWAGKDGDVGLWSMTSSVRWRTLERAVGPPKALVFSADARLLAATSAGKVHVWSVGDGVVLRTMEAPEEIGVFSAAGDSLAFSPDGQFLAAVRVTDGSVAVWRIADGSRQYTLPGFDAAVRALAPSLDGNALASEALDGTVWLWAIAEGAPFELLRSGEAFDHRPETGLAFSLDGQTLALGAEGGQVLLWGLPEQSVLRTLSVRATVSSPATGQVGGVAFSPDGQTVAACLDSGTVWLWRAASGAIRWVLEGCSQNLTGPCQVSFSPDGLLLAATFPSGKVCSWRTDDGTPVPWLATARMRYLAKWAAFSPDGRLLAVLTYEGIELYSVVDGAHVRYLWVPLGQTTSAVWSPDGHIVAVGLSGGTICLLDVAEGEVVAVLGGHVGVVNGLAFSGDGRVLVSASDDGTIRLWAVGPAADSEE